MSNCIDLVAKTKVDFKPWEINTEGLRKYLAECEEKVNDNNCSSDKVDPVLRMGWWFLSLNTDFKPRGGCVIYFGEGRSSHTWRDLKGTVKILSDYVISDKRWHFVATDEFDGHNSRFDIKINFKEGTVVG